MYININYLRGDQMTYNTIEILKALADPIRLSIVKKLCSENELCVCNILDDFSITQPTLSFHMKKLTQCGLVTSRKDGTWVRYQVNQEYIDSLLTEITSIKKDDITSNIACDCNTK